MIFLDNPLNLQKIGNRENSESIIADIKNRLSFAELKEKYGNRFAGTKNIYKKRYTGYRPSGKKSKKLRGDVLVPNNALHYDIGADALVIITETLPNGNIFSFVDGVYIVSFKEFKTVSLFIRNFLLKIAENNVSNANKGTKAEMLYNYLTSNEFKVQFESYNK